MEKGRGGKKSKENEGRGGKWEGEEEWKIRRNRRVEKPGGEKRGKRRGKGRRNVMEKRRGARWIE